MRSRGFVIPRHKFRQSSVQYLYQMLLFFFRDTKTDKFYVKVGLERKFYSVESVQETDSDGSASHDRRKELAFLFLKEPVKFDEARACTICFPTFDYHPSCIKSGADLTCQVFALLPGK
jgi:hypothetical protein